MMKQILALVFLFIFYLIMRHLLPIKYLYYYYFCHVISDLCLDFFINVSVVELQQNLTYLWIEALCNDDENLIKHYKSWTSKFYPKSHEGKLRQDGKSPALNTLYIWTRFYYLLLNFTIIKQVCFIYKCVNNLSGSWIILLQVCTFSINLFQTRAEIIWFMEDFTIVYLRLWMKPTS